MGWIQTMNIMLVENNLKIRDLIKQIIVEEMRGVETFFECNDGEEAIDRYGVTMPDWVLMDIEMDRMDGITASKALLKRFPDAKIMFVTQYDDPDYREAARKMGAYAYVLKEDLVDIPVLLKSMLK